MAVQEARVTWWEKNGTEQTARNAGWRTAISPCKVTDLGGRSAGVAVASRNHVGMRNSLDPELWPEELKDRFTLKRAGAVCKGGINLGSAYLV